MRAAIAHNGSFFNAQRMVSQCVDSRLALDLVRAELPVCCRAHPVRMPTAPTADGSRHEVVV